jgi:hypothetical protein
MKTLAATGVTFLLIEAIAASAFGAFEVSAQEKKEAYVPAADVKTLLDKQLPGVEDGGYDPPWCVSEAGWVGGMRYPRPGVRIRAGGEVSSTSGKPRQTITPGHSTRRSATHAGAQYQRRSR